MALLCSSHRLQPVFELPLFGARVQFTENAGTISSGIIAGAVSQNDIDTTLIPAWTTGIQEEVAAACTDPTSPPNCGCQPSSPGERWIKTLDTSGNCAIEFEEVKNSSLISVLLAPDVTINGSSGLSVGVGFTAVPASFTP